MSRLPSDLHEAEVAFHRGLFRIQPVELHEMPRWWMERVCWATSGWGFSAAHNGMQALERRWDAGPFFDHWGKSYINYDGQRIATFVTEPYRDASDQKLQSNAYSIASYLGVNVIVEGSMQSWWFPGNTIRIEFVDIPFDSECYIDRDTFRDMHHDRKRMKRRWL